MLYDDEKIIIHRLKHEYIMIVHVLNVSLLLTTECMMSSMMGIAKFKWIFNICCHFAFLSHTSPSYRLP